MRPKNSKAICAYWKKNGRLNQVSQAERNADLSITPRNFEAHLFTYSFTKFPAGAFQVHKNGRKAIDGKDVVSSEQPRLSCGAARDDAIYDELIEVARLLSHSVSH